MHNTGTRRTLRMKQILPHVRASPAVWTGTDSAVPLSSRLAHILCRLLPRVGPNLQEGDQAVPGHHPVLAPGPLQLGIPAGCPAAPDPPPAEGGPPRKQGQHSRGKPGRAVTQGQSIRVIGLSVCPFVCLSTFLVQYYICRCLLLLSSQTLFVCFLRASLVTKVSPRLWDSLLAVLSSLTQWKEVVTQWKVSSHTSVHIFTLILTL